MHSVTRLLALSGLIFLLALPLTASAKSAPCKTNPADQTAVADTLRTMYKAATADDLAGFDALLAPGFYAFDGGTRYDANAIMKLVMQYHARGARFVWTVTEPDVHINCDEAWIAYVNQGSIQLAPDSPATPPDLAGVCRTAAPVRHLETRLPPQHPRRAPQSKTVAQYTTDRPLQKPVNPQNRKSPATTPSFAWRTSFPPTSILDIASEKPWPPPRLFSFFDNKTHLTLFNGNI
jgi:hypothetical protein